MDSHNYLCQVWRRGKEWKKTIENGEKTYGQGGNFGPYVFYFWDLKY